ncbi:MAG: WD40/YVTN/BNR-like repeat-containing protein [Alphaproteobacteria bacterium]
MTENITYLSPNGQNVSYGTGTVTRIYAGTVRGVVTLDRQLRGKPWIETARELDDLHVGSLLFEDGSGRLFAGCHHDGGLWVAENGGEGDWHRLDNGPDRPHIYSLSSRKIDGRVTLFAGTAPAALYRSDDLGETWTEVSALRNVPDADKWTFIPPPHLPHVKNMAFHPSDPDTYFVLVEQGALLKTTDDGASFTEIDAYAAPGDRQWNEVHRLLIHPTDPALMYLATGEGLYRTRDGGASFENVLHGGPRMGYPEFLYLDPSDHKTVLMAGSRLNPTEWFRDGIADSTILRSIDQGDSWTEPNAGFPNPVIGAFEAMSMHLWYGGMMLVIGTATGELYATDDYCRSWVCLYDAAPAFSKDDHHLPFMSDEERAEAMAERGLT